MVKCVQTLLCVACVVCIVCVVFLIKRKKQSQRENNRDKTPFELDDIPRGSVDTTASVANPVYQNVADIHQHHQGNVRSFFQCIAQLQRHRFLHYNCERMIVFVTFKSNIQDIIIP